VIDIVHWIGCGLFMENHKKPFSSSKFRDFFKEAREIASKADIPFPSLHRIEALRETFIPTVADMTLIEDIFTDICSSNVCMESVVNISVDESILQASARIENCKRSEPEKEMRVDSSGMSKWEERKASIGATPIVDIPGKEHSGFQSISAGIKLHVTSPRTFHEKKKEYQNTRKQGYKLGIYFLKHDVVTWKKVFHYYFTKFGPNKHFISDAHFSSEDLFFLHLLWALK